MLIFTRSKLYFTASGMSLSVSGCIVDRLRAYCSALSTGALHGRVTIPDAVKIQFCPPKDEHSIARNMSRYLM
jgi:hypothetical protein